MTEAERITFLIDNLAGGNGEAFAKKIGKSKAAVSRMKRGLTGIRLTIDAIIEAYPAVNREWLETGEGDPGDLSVALVKNRLQKKITQNEMIIEKLINRINELESLLKTSETF